MSNRVFPGQADHSSLQGLPDESSVWVYGFKEKLTPQERRKVESSLQEFLPTWLSHGQPVTAAYSMIEDRLVVVAAHCPGGISGCSIDSGVAVFKQLQEKHALDAMDRSLIFYRDQDGRVQSEGFFQFQHLVDSGFIQPTTVVFDTTIQTLRGFRSAFELEFQNSWHSRRFST